MTINDESFYNIKGEEVSRALLVQAMIDYYESQRQVGQTKVTDFNEGSEIRNLLESFSVDAYTILENQLEVSKIAFIQTAYGEWLDLHGQHPLIRLERNTGTEAVGICTFSIPEAEANETFINAGTILASTENGLYYLTDNDAVINAGEVSVDCPVTCATVGVDGNCSAGTITLIEDTNIEDYITVTNNSAFLGGVDYEDDDTYRQRLLDFVRQDDFGSYPYYVRLGESVEGVHDVILINDEEYTRKVIVNADEKPVPDTLLLQVLAEYTDTNNRVITHTFTVEAVDYTVVDLDLDLEVYSEIETDIILDTLSCLFDGGTTLNNYTFEGCSIDEEIGIEAIAGALETIDEITNVTVTVDSLVPDANTVLKLGEVNIEQVII